MSLRGVGRMLDMSARDQRAWQQLISTLAWVAGTGVQVVNGVLQIVLNGNSLTQSASGLSVQVSADADNTLTVESDGLKSTGFSGTAVGDLFVWNGTAVVALPVGTDGQILYADSTQVTGLRWGDPPAGAASGFSSGFSSGFGV